MQEVILSKLKTILTPNFLPNRMKNFIPWALDEFTQCGNSFLNLLIFKNRDTKKYILYTYILKPKIYNE
jgi:hypothetical protein